MTPQPQKPLKIPLYAGTQVIHDSVWGCKHMLRVMEPAQFLILRVPIADLKFYFAMRRRGECRVTMITLDMTLNRRLSLSLGKKEKPLYLCEACQSELLRVTHHLHCTTSPAYGRPKP